ncbi:hypothetical protein N7539_004249 [Penicillium diatomitis]|uniref:Transmembrane protein n=1 Tax=Penicillium diatomitis TaxID=2819901 RepID=A0A9X0BYB2_9EURO|nr:uncharacterized protein N7539_004249 [Penicillium diatomitis]KAJ5489359.1 hypothetical protein N7539_004249 [Penicillium diatomitis]
MFVSISVSESFLGQETHTTVHGLVERSLGTRTGPTYGISDIGKPDVEYAPKMIALASPVNEVHELISVPSMSRPHSATSTLVARNGFSRVFDGSSSVVAITLLVVIAVCAIVFMAAWSLREGSKCKRRKRRVGFDHFAQSDVSLAEDTSRTLDTFLMKDVYPERNTLMLSRSPSPPFIGGMDGAESFEGNDQIQDGRGETASCSGAQVTPTRKITWTPRRSPLSSSMSADDEDFAEDVDTSPSKKPFGALTTPRSLPYRPRSLQSISIRTPTTPPTNRAPQLRVPSASRASSPATVHKEVPLGIHLSKSQPTVETTNVSTPRTVSQNTVIHISPPHPAKSSSASPAKSILGPGSFSVEVNSNPEPSKQD